MIIKSLLDNDFYKYSMQMAVFHQFPATQVEYEFVCRTPNIWFTQEQMNRINAEIDNLCTLKFTQDELDYLKTIRFLKSDYIEFLEDFRLKRRHVKVYQESFCINNPTEFYPRIIISGSWLNTILFEVPILAIVNEVYFEGKWNKQIAVENFEKKLGFIRDNREIRFSDFGTRRRVSGEFQDWAVDYFSHLLNFNGTSNVLLAKKHGVTPIGTMAHEWIQAGQAVGPRLIDSQKYMLEKWVQEYRGDLGIALTDTVSMNAFLRDFDPYFAKLYDGCRHDSGDPIKWGESLIKHYESLRIDPTTKTAVFSDNLNFDKASRIYQHFLNRIKVSFGIGTFLTNDTDIKPISIVIKMTKCNEQAVAKLSDEIAKTICRDNKYIEYLKDVFQYEV